MSIEIPPKADMVAAYAARNSRTALTEVRAASHNMLLALGRINGLDDISKPGAFDTAHGKYLGLLENAFRVITEHGIRGDASLIALTREELKALGSSVTLQFYLQTTAILIVETHMHYFSGKKDLAWTYAFDAVETSRKLLFGFELISEETRKLHAVNQAKKGAKQRHVKELERKEWAVQTFREWRASNPNLTKSKAAEELLAEFRKRQVKVSYETVRGYLDNL